MKGKIIRTMAVILAVTIMSGTTVFAAPKTMSDGGIFDPEYYAQQNPDVVAALGTDENILYQHYLNNGKSEGRLPYDPSTAANDQNSVSTTDTAPVVVQTYYYDYFASDSAYPTLKRLLEIAKRNNVITLQIMSDGSVYMTESNSSKALDIFVNTGKEGAVEGSYIYKNIASATGKPNDKELDFTPEALRLMHLSDNGRYMSGEVYAGLKQVLGL